MVYADDIERGKTVCIRCMEPKEAHIAVADKDVNAGAEHAPVLICPRSVYQPVSRDAE